MTWIDRLKKWWRDARDYWAFAGLVSIHDRMGSVNPKAAAMQEIAIRGQIERCRDHVSDEIIKDPSLSPWRLARHWVKDHTAFTLDKHSRDMQGQMKRAVEGLMVQELLHPDAYKVYEAHRHVESAKILSRRKTDGNVLGLDRHELRVLRRD